MCSFLAEFRVKTKMLLRYEQILTIFQHIFRKFILLYIRAHIRFSLFPFLIILNRMELLTPAIGIQNRYTSFRINRAVCQPFDKSLLCGWNR